MTPKKKVEPKEEPALEPVVETKEPEAPRVVKEAKPALCGHVNKHYYGPGGALEDLTCTLAAGHTGDHSATHKKKVGEPEHDEKGRVKKVVYHEEDAVAFWGDAAGKPAAAIQEGEVAQMTLMQKDLVMQLLAKNPDMKVDQAVAQAKGMPQWNSVAEPS